MVVGTLSKVQTRWIQWMQSQSGHSHTVDAVDVVCSGIVVYGGGDIVFDRKRSKQWTQ